MDLIQNKNFTTPSGQATQHTFFEIILLAIVCAIFYWFMVLPKAHSNDALGAQAASLTAEYNKLSDNRHKLEKAVADMNSHADEIRALDEALPLDNRITKLYIALAQLTNNSGMTVGDMSISGGNDGPVAGNIDLLQAPFKAKRTLQKLATSLSVSGTFDQFQGLLEKLETSGRLINVNNIAINATKDSLLDFQIGLEAYYYE